MDKFEEALLDAKFLGAVSTIRMSLEKASDVEGRKRIVRELLQVISDEFGDELLEVVNELE